MSLTEIVQMMEKAYVSRMALPEKIRVNDQLLKQLLNGLYIDSDLHTFMNVPVEVDNSVDLFKIDYKQFELK